MAKLPALVTAIAAKDGRDRKSVDHVARVIREAGFMPTGKRGSGAAEMTVSAAANLMIALNGAEAPKDGPRAIEVFRSLRTQKLEGDGTQPQALLDIEDTKTFGEALERLIEGVPELVHSIREYVATAYTDPDKSEKTNFEAHSLIHAMINEGSGPVTLSVTLSHLSAEMKLKTSQANGPRIEWHVRFLADADLFMKGFYGGDNAAINGGPDRHVEVTFGVPTLFAIGRCLDGSDDE